MYDHNHERSQDEVTDNYFIFLPGSSRLYATWWGCLIFQYSENKAGC